MAYRGGKVSMHSQIYATVIVPTTRSLAQPLELPPGWIDCPPFGKAPIVGGKKLNVIPSKVRGQICK